MKAAPWIDGPGIKAPTRRVERVQSDTGYEESAFEPLCSVELGETAKGDVQIKSVKVYSQSIVEAGEQALAEFLRLKGLTNYASTTDN